MPRAVTPIKITLSADERRELEQRARAQTAAHRVVVRAQMVLMLADGVSISCIARTLQQQRRIVCKWGQRFVERRIDGLDDLKGRGHAASFSPSGRASSHQAGLRAS